jgi:ubiquinone/menaquinone biosynthesis C-methylase UbiE
MTKTCRLFARVAVIAAVGALAPGLAHAQLGGRSAEEWIKTLDSADRLQGLKIAEVVDALKLTPGQIVADIGAGAGAFTLPLARAVRPGGTALAVEVDEKLLEHIAETATEGGVTNVVTVYGEYDDPLLGGDVDLALIHDVLHHIENRELYLKNLAGYLKPTGRVVIIDYIPGMGGHRDDEQMQLSRSQVTALMAQAGMKLVEEVDGLFDNKFFVIYAK